MATITLKNCRLVKELSNGFNEGMADVVLEGGKIKTVGAAGTVTAEPGDAVYDCEGKTLLPGLYDIHQHSDAMSVNFLDNWAIRDPFAFVNASCLWSKRLLKMGYTTLRCMGSPDRLGVKVRNVIDSGVFNGPKIFACGNGISVTGKSEMNDNPQFDGANEWKKAARTEMAKGSDFIKIFVSGSVMSTFGEPGQLVITYDEIEAAVHAARARNIYTAAHCHSAESIKLALDAGVYTIEHATYCNKELRDRIKNSEGKHYLVPTLAVMQWCAEIANTDNPALYYLAERAGWVIDAAKENIGSAYAEGHILGWGTDLDVESLEKEPGIEFRLRKEWCGMSNIDMLLQATTYSAKIVGLGDVSGQIKEGFEADLVLFDGKPDEDIAVMNKYPDMVFKRGRLVQD